MTLTSGKACLATRVFHILEARLQFGDGFTKFAATSCRPSETPQGEVHLGPRLCDAKKKSTSAEKGRNENVMGEDAMMYENFAAIMNDLPIDENLETEIEQHPENDLALENTKLAVETCVHENEEIVDLPYVQPYIMPTAETFASRVGPCIVCHDVLRCSYC